jgi:dephospho-CoA kinase
MDCEYIRQLDRLTRVLLVALTGGIGSGKSLAAEYFAELGAQVLDFDQLARDVIERGTEGFDEVIARFGDEILSQGIIDRSKLAAIVFSDSSMRQDLEAIVHPRIRQEFDSIVSGLEGDSILISQIPLLVESKNEYPFEFVITVSAPEEIRRARLLERGMKNFQITKRIEAQSSDQAREAIADAIIHNTGDKDHLLRQVENLYEDRIYPMRFGKSSQ